MPFLVRTQIAAHYNRPAQKTKETGFGQESGFSTHTAAAYFLFHHTAISASWPNSKYSTVTVCGPAPRLAVPTSVVPAMIGPGADDGIAVDEDAHAVIHLGVELIQAAAGEVLRAGAAHRPQSLRGTPGYGDVSPQLKLSTGAITLAAGSSRFLIADSRCTSTRCRWCRWRGGGGVGGTARNGRHNRMHRPPGHFLIVQVGVSDAGIFVVFHAHDVIARAQRHIDGVSLPAGGVPSDRCTRMLSDEQPRAVIHVRPRSDRCPRSALTVRVQRTEK